ncbi:MATE family efflux transporter [Fastidiosipila sanguinis]|uniref:Probable multidrug resistance protein NorM n=1 Tax=Fastidiosipila sanguinis TaxID=236753 RepID=A0A2S0KLL7_9FIRM|nr:MATE family efflux transporter [Fastidiosipila sanguinis]AVM41930.1 MATE family efflux transporter [Fastidiosipila sanguinis]
MAVKSLKRMNNIDTTTGVIWKKILLFTLPILLSNFLQQLYGTVDMIILGTYGSSTALGAVGTTTSLTNVLLGLFVGISTGSSVALAQAYGASDNRRIYKVVHSTIFWGLISGIVLTAIGLIFSRPLLELMNCPGSLIEEATTYMVWIFVGMIPISLYNMGSAVLRAIGDSRRPFYFLIAAAVTNIILDYIFVGLFDWNVFGAAMATIISQAVAAVLTIVTLVNANGAYRLYLKEVRPYKEESMMIIKIGVPAGFQSAIISSSNALIQSQVNKFGEGVVEAYAAFNRLDGFYYMSINSFSVAATTFVGQNLGAKKYHRVRKGIKVSIMLGVIVAIFVGIIMGVFREEFLDVFNLAPENMEYGKFAIAMDSLAYWIFAIGDVLSGAIRGAGKSLFPMISSLINMFGIRQMWVFGIQKVNPSFQAIILAYPVSWIFQTTMMLTYFIRGNWLPEDLAEEIAEELDGDLIKDVSADLSSDEDADNNEIEAEVDAETEVSELEGSAEEQSVEVEEQVEVSEEVTEKTSEEVDASEVVDEVEVQEKVADAEQNVDVLEIEDEKNEELDLGMESSIEETDIILDRLETDPENIYPDEGSTYPVRENDDQNPDIYPQK